MKKVLTEFGAIAVEIDDLLLADAPGLPWDYLALYLTRSGRALLQAAYIPKMTKMDFARDWRTA